MGSLSGNRVRASALTAGWNGPCHIKCLSIRLCPAVHPGVRRPRMPLDLTFLVGDSLAAVVPPPARFAAWKFRFSSGAEITSECLWRIFASDRICVTSEDHGQHFGLPEPVDACAQLRAMCAAKIESIVLPRGTSDLTLRFRDAAELQFIATSGGYEAWQLRHPRAGLFVAQGGGTVCHVA